MTTRARAWHAGWPLVRTWTVVPPDADPLTHCQRILAHITALRRHALRLRTMGAYRATVRAVEHRIAYLESCIRCIADDVIREGVR